MEERFRERLTCFDQTNLYFKFLSEFRLHTSGPICSKCFISVAKLQKEPMELQLKSTIRKKFSRLYGEVGISDPSQNVQVYTKILGTFGPPCLWGYIPCENFEKEVEKDWDPCGYVTHPACWVEWFSPGTIGGGQFWLSWWLEDIISVWWAGARFARIVLAKICWEIRILLNTRILINFLKCYWV